MVFIAPSGASYDFDVETRKGEYRVQPLNQQDLDRNFCLATASIFKWMQAARMELPWMQAGYRAFSELEPRMTRRLLVATQAIRLVKPGILAQAVDNEVITRVEIGDVGRTSIEFRYELLFGVARFATATTVMIVTSGTPGSFKPSPVPEDIKAIAAAGTSEDNTFVRDTLASVPKTPPPHAYSTAVAVRYSDEDVNKHANHSAQARFLEDVKEAIANDASADGDARRVAEQQLEAIVIAYVAEVRALDQLVVKAAPALGTPAALDVWVERVAPRIGMVARGRLVCGGGKADDCDNRRLRTAKL